MFNINYLSVTKAMEKRFNTLAPSTIKNYMSQLKKFNELNIKNTEAIKKHIVKKYKLSNCKQAIIALIKYLKLDEVKNKNILCKYQKILDNFQIELQTNPQQTPDEKEIPFDKLLLVLKKMRDNVNKNNLFDEKLNKISKKKQTILTDYIALLLFTLQSPQKPNKYCNMFVVKFENYNENNNKNNFLIIKNERPEYFIFNDNKTSKKHKSLKIKIEHNELKNILKKYINVININNNYKNLCLFVTWKNEPLKSNAMGKKIQRVFIKSKLESEISIIIIKHLGNIKISDEKKIEHYNIRKKLAFEIGKI